MNPEEQAELDIVCRAQRNRSFHAGDDEGYCLLGYNVM
jgi:hypothetical protein